MEKERVSFYLEKEIAEKLRKRASSKGLGLGVYIRSQILKAPIFGEKKKRETQAKIKEKPKTAALTENEDLKINEAIARYVDAFFTRYKARPVLRPQDLKQIKNLKLNKERLSDLLQVYVQMKNPWFLKKKHDLATFINNLNVIASALDLGEEKEESTTWKSENEMLSILNKKEETKGLVAK